MPMRKEMTATAVASTTIFPLVGFSAAQLLNQTATAPQQSIPVRVRKTVNEVIVPNLKKGWAKQVLPCFRPALTADEVHTLERALNAYVLGRVARTNPIFWDDFHARLEGFARTSRALLDEFDSLGPAYSLAWSKIVELSKRCPERRLDRDSIYPILSALHASSVRALERACERRQAGIKGDHAAAWTELIVKLAELFERAGDRATAPKGRRGDPRTPALIAVGRRLPARADEHVRHGVATSIDVVRPRRACL